MELRPLVPENTVGTFHTHPGIIATQLTGPSFDDIQLADKHQLPGVLIDSNISPKKTIKFVVYYNTSEGWL